MVKLIKPPTYLRILVIFPDSFPHVGSKKQDDVFIQRISMTVYSKLPTKIRGNDYHAVFLVQGVSMADLEKYPDSFTILKAALSVNDANIITTKYEQR